MKLEGEHVRLVPLVRGENDERGVLVYVVWQTIEQAGDWGKIFWEEDDPKRGDLLHWCSYLANNQTVLVMFVDKQGALAGVFWFNTYNDDEKSAWVHLWVEPAHRGEATREMTEMTARYGFEVLGLKRIIGVTPYAITRNLGVKYGFRETERGEYMVNGRLRKLYKIEREAA